MTYLPTMGSIDSTQFNSSRYPGVCKPTNEATLQIFYDLQKQLNRLAQLKGFTKIAVDGDIGPGTVKLVNLLKSTVLDMSADSSTCIAIAINADTIASNAKMAADTAGVPAKVSSPIPPKAPTIITPAGVELKAPPPVGASAFDSFKNLGMPIVLALGAGIVGVGYFIARKKKGRK